MFVVLSFWIITKCTISFTLLITHAKIKDQSVVEKGKEHV